MNSILAAFLEQSHFNYLSSGLTWICVVFGAVFGSFLNVCIHRIPTGTFFAQARSVCPGCGAGIPAYYNIPLFSWLWLKGRAACCGQKISWRYPLVELLTAVLFPIIYWKFPFVMLKGQQLEWDYINLLRAVHLAVFACLLIVCSVIDLRLMIIPDSLSLPMIAATPLVAWLQPDLDMTSALLGVLAGGLSLYSIAWIYWLLRREVGMGMGDVKLLAAIGGWCGYQAILPTIFYGSLIGALGGLAVVLVSRKLTLRSAIPFGPFLALGAVLHLLCGSYIEMRFLVPG